LDRGRLEDAIRSRPRTVKRGSTRATPPAG
jgi:hypothetical protein